MSVANFGIWVSFTARVCKNPKLSETRPDPENWGISGFGLDKPDPHISPTRKQISGILGFESGLPQENSKKPVEPSYLSKNELDISPFWPKALRSKYMKDFVWFFEDMKIWQFASEFF